jgi:hypothetical protein
MRLRRRDWVEKEIAKIGRNDPDLANAGALNETDLYIKVILNIRVAVR